MVLNSTEQEKDVKMESMDKIFVSKFNVNNGKVLYAKVEWIKNDTDLFHIIIFDGENWWTGRYSNEFAKIYRERVEENEEEYCKLVKSSLSRQDKFEYNFSPVAGNPSAAQFTWKKSYQGEHGPITLVLGSVPVHIAESKGNADYFVDILLDENKTLKQIANQYKVDIDGLNAELQKSKTEFAKFIDMKTSLESSLYGKFITLLNSKKRRIQVLEENFNELQKSAVQDEVD